MSKTNFVSGTPVSASFLNAINNPIFDGQDFDGHYSKITNSDLSDAAGQIKTEWTTFRDTLLVSAGTGLSVNYTGGAITLEDGTLTVIAPSAITVPASSTSYIFVNTSGAVAVSSTYPTRGLMLASVTTLANTINSIVDLRPRFIVRPRFNAISVFGGIGVQGDYTLNSGSASLNGDYYYRDFTLAAGATINCTTGFLYIKCSGNVTINGSINISAPISGGGRFGSSFSPQDYPASSGQGIGGATGHGASASPTYNYAQFLAGSGGASGFSRVSGAAFAGFTSQGGNGGGCIIIEAAGTITIGGTIISDGGDAINPGATSIGAPVIAKLAGGGGGSGGLIFLKSLNSIAVTAAATLSVKGGRGANGYVFGDTSFVYGGGGGGGGYIVLVSPNVNTTGATISLTGGAIGTAAGSNASGSIGGSNGGSFGGSGGLGGNSPQIGSAGQFVVRNFTPT
ncbi:hypothetical protein LC607_18070 [Nostoc sp. CHAB 5824]|nr:hypothetical protein [Nostoc sp. CHAB 5824]